MYHEEKTLNGILVFRSSQYGNWIEFSKEELTEKIAILERSLSVCEKELSREKTFELV